MSERPTIGAVIIGRNEGERLIRCLASIPAGVDPVVYVDSGSTDNSVQAAIDAGAEIVKLDSSKPFTAARARNAGFKALMRQGALDFVQFIDGDCELRENWIESAADYLRARPDFAVICGRRRERFPENSIYNRLCDWEWDTPVGDAKACGGDALMRVAAIEDVDGFDPTLIAGEEPELCVRLRAKGWRIWRLDREMAWHDAAMTRLGQWWRRTKRGGYAYAQGAAMHGAPPERHWVSETRRAILWGALTPAVICVGGLLCSPWFFFGALIYPTQVIRLALRHGGTRDAWERAIFLTLAKFAEAQGAMQYWFTKLRNRRAELIEYK